MATLSLTLSEQLKNAAEARAAAAGFASVDEYIASLIEADDLPPITGDLEADLLAGLDSGPSIPLDEQLLEDVKRRARRTGPNGK